MEIKKRENTGLLISAFGLNYNGKSKLGLARELADTLVYSTRTSGIKKPS